MDDINTVQGLINYLETIPDKNMPVYVIESNEIIPLNSDNTGIGNVGIFSLYDEPVSPGKTLFHPTTPEPKYEERIKSAVKALIFNYYDYFTSREG